MGTFPAESYKDLGECVSSGAADVAFSWVECHIVDGLVKLLSVGGELLDAGLTLHVPQTDGAVMTWRGKEPIRTENRDFQEHSSNKLHCVLLGFYVTDQHKVVDLRSVEYISVKPPLF
ncbi:hypothetical protein AMECASPLE_033398 [Ameca splendens]|uniref:Uncharacterized protein n=1 Tax=Ameca splendens TaxID=208324 RepID=A0ABV0Z4S5_9TELE